MAQGLNQPGILSSGHYMLTSAQGLQPAICSTGKHPMRIFGQAVEAETTPEDHFALEICLVTDVDHKRIFVGIIHAACCSTDLLAAFVCHNGA